MKIKAKQFYSATGNKRAATDRNIKIKSRNIFKVKKKKIHWRIYITKGFRWTQGEAPFH